MKTIRPAPRILNSRSPLPTPVFLLLIFFTGMGCAQADMSMEKAADQSSLYQSMPEETMALERAEESMELDDVADGLFNTSAQSRKTAAGASSAPRPNPSVQPGKPDSGNPAAFPSKPELPRFEIARDRLLEYTVTLRYRTDDVARSRAELYKIVSRYGYLTQATTEADDRFQVGANFRVKVEHLYEVIDALKNVGELESESIHAQDHTENMVLQSRKARREIARSGRRKNAPATAKTWAQKEALISAGEDQLDAAEHEKWKIQDRVAWANFTVSLIGPEAPAKVHVPRFGNAFVGMLNLLLNLFYGLIVISPLLLIGGGLFWLVRRFFQKRKAGAN